MAKTFKLLILIQYHETYTGGLEQKDTQGSKTYSSGHMLNVQEESCLSAYINSTYKLINQDDIVRYDQYKSQRGYIFTEFLEYWRAYAP